MYLTYREFASAVNVNYNTLRQHIHRGQVASDGGFINTQRAKNVKYIKKQTNKRGLDMSGVVERERVLLSDDQIARKEHEIQKKMSELVLIDYVESIMKINLDTTFKSIAAKGKLSNYLAIDILKDDPNDLKRILSELTQLTEISIEKLKLKTTSEIKNIYSIIDRSETMKKALKLENHGSND